MSTTNHRAVATACVVAATVAITGSDNSISIIGCGSWNRANKVHQWHI